MEQEAELPPASGENISKSFWKKAVMWFLVGAPVENGDFLGTEQSVEYSNIIGPEEDRAKRTHSPEAVVGQAQGWHCMHLFIQARSEYL